MQLLRVCLALVSGVAVANGKLVTENPFTINAACSQLGEEPAGLSGDLPAGYDYACYEKTASVERWSTSAGFPSGLMGSDDMMADLTKYLMEFVVPVAVLFGFGLLSCICCSCWSCGMMHCCATPNRKCCGKCCANPPKFTEGKCEYLLFFMILGAGGAAVILAIMALATNTAQGNALDKIPGTVGILSSWVNSTGSALSTTLGSFNDASAVANGQVESYNAMKTTEFGEGAAAACAAIATAFTEAASGIGTLNETIGGLSGTVGDLDESLAGSIDSVNGPRKSFIFLIWLGLMGLMIFTILISAARQKAPDCFYKMSCCFGAVTCVYLLVLIILVLFCTIFMIITILLGDFCTDPDTLFTDLIGSAAGGDTDDSSAAATSSDAALSLSIDPIALFTYYLTCDTLVGAINPLNAQVTPVFDGLLTVDSELKTNLNLLVDTTNNVFEAGFANACPNGATDATAECADYKKSKAAGGEGYDDWQTDKVGARTNIDKLVASFNVVLQSVMGENATEAVAGIVVPEQGMTDGLFSSMQCYQFNSRYQALVNLICTNTYTTIAMMLEYMISAMALMIVVEFLKRWARPFNDEVDGGSGDSGGEEVDLEGNTVSNPAGGGGKWTTAFN